MKIGKFVHVNLNTFKIMKNTWKFTEKPGKIMEKSENFVSPEKWEPRVISSQIPSRFRGQVVYYLICIPPLVFLVSVLSVPQDFRVKVR